ncbi:metal-dependent hydrolase [Methanobrevibacter boviskoreani]|uniref:metal-dependent hydrolase n=1 Tax=Methanobrevibacter boviskoreani TaxID=1348249 RepID=UPI003C6DB4EB
MSSYKLHSLFGLVLGLLFFQNPLAIYMSLVSSNIPDNDHKLRKDNVYKLIITGLLIFIVLYILKLPYYLGILLCILGLIFYFSSHRGFTHSLLGIVILSSLIFSIIKLGSSILLSLGLFGNYQYSHYLSILIFIILMSIFSLNRRLVLPSILIFSGLFYLFPNIYLNDYIILFSIVIGLFSHIILDSFTSSGVKVLYPLSGRKFYKKFGIVSLIILIILAILIYNGFLLLLINFLFKNYDLSLFIIKFHNLMF